MSVALDLDLLNRIAQVLILVAVARVASDRLRFDLWFFSVYSLAAGPVAIGLLLATQTDFKIDVFLFGFATVAGFYWTGLARPGARLRRQGHLVAAGAALVLVGAMVLVAILYQWWITPAIILAAMLARLAVDGAVLFLGTPRSTSPRPELARPPTSSNRRPEPADAARSAAQVASPAPLTLPIQCPSCGLRGAVPVERAGKTLACPRCRTAVKVPAEAGRSFAPASAVPVPATREPAAPKPTAAANLDKRSTRFERPKGGASQSKARPSSGKGDDRKKSATRPGKG